MNSLRERDGGWKAVVLPALTSGEIDYHMVVSPAVNAALRGIPVRVVACFTPGLTTAIIARSEVADFTVLREAQREMGIK